MLRIPTAVFARAPGALVLAALLSASARAGATESTLGAPSGESGGEPARVPSFRIGLGTGLTLGLSEIEQNGGDVVGITQAFFPWSLSVAPSYPLTPRWTGGLRVSWASDAGMRGDETRTLWQLAIEGRYQPGGQQGLYLGVNAGAADAIDGRGSASASQWAPRVGAAFGYDAAVLNTFALGIELSGAFAAFDREGASLRHAGGTERYVYGPSSWLSLSLVASLGI